MRATLSELPLPSPNKSLKRSSNDEARSESDWALKALSPLQAWVLMHVTQSLQTRKEREREREREREGECRVEEHTSEL